MKLLVNIFRWLRGHKWQYPLNGNPYDRRCKLCGRHESWYEWSWGGRGWWEVFNEGDARLHYSAKHRPPQEGEP